MARTGSRRPTAATTTGSPRSRSGTTRTTSSTSTRTSSPAPRAERMSHPVLFVIDDDAGVVRALRDDLSRRFGEDFRVTGASSAAAGLAMLRELADEHVTVAVLIADHKMPEMPGVEFLARAHGMHPRAKRVLLV